MFEGVNPYTRDRKRAFWGIVAPVLLTAIWVTNIVLAILRLVEATHIIGIYKNLAVSGWVGYLICCILILVFCIVALVARCRDYLEVRKLEKTYSHKR